MHYEPVTHPGNIGKLSNWEFPYGWIIIPAQELLFLLAQRLGWSLADADKFLDMYLSAFLRQRVGFHILEEGYLAVSPTTFRGILTAAESGKFVISNGKVCIHTEPTFEDLCQFSK